MDYYFSVAKGVLPDCARDDVLPARRQYIPKGSRPLVCTSAVSGAGSQTLGQSERLRGDGTTARAKPTTASDAGDDASHRLAAADVCGLGSLTTVDAETGTRCVRYTPGSMSSSSGAAVQSVVSSPVPSGRRLVSLVPAPHAGGSGSDAALFASDDKGNTYLFRPSRAGEAAASAKRTRVEARSSDPADDAETDAWRLLVPARSALPSCVVDGAESAAAALFSHALGAPGWAGLVSLDAGTLVCAREHYQDLRVVDVAHGTVVRSFATTHPATGLISPGHTAWTGTDAAMAPELAHHVVLVAEGCLATLFDVRCPSAVMSLTAACSAPHATTDSADAASPEAASTAAAATGPLVPGRLTSVNGQVRDVCHTVHPYEVAAAVDRAVSVYDYRKFTRAFSASNVLKYTIASLAPFAGGRAVVCNGIDAEVRIIALHGKDTLYTTAETPLSLTANQAAASRPSANAKNKEDASAPAPEDPSGSTFRTRLNSSVSCSSTWQGGWASAVDGRVAVGISMDNELFFVQ